VNGGHGLTLRFLLVLEAICCCAIGFGAKNVSLLKNVNADKDLNMVCWKMILSGCGFFFISVSEKKTMSGLCCLVRFRSSRYGSHDPV
jgi:hypothetical protein